MNILNSLKALASPKLLAMDQEASDPTAADRFLEQAQRFIGQPYQWGGGHGDWFDEPGPVDCSGLISQAAHMAGLELSGTTSSLKRQGKPIKLSQVEPGDLVFKGSPVYHVGIYVGNGQVLHAPEPGQPVGYVDLSYFDSARRVFDQPAQPLETGSLAAAAVFGRDRLQLSRA